MGWPLINYLPPSRYLLAMTAQAAHSDLYHEPQPGMGFALCTSCSMRSRERSRLRIFAARKVLSAKARRGFQGDLLGGAGALGGMRQATCGIWHHKHPTLRL